MIVVVFAFIMIAENTSKQTNPISMNILCFHQQTKNGTTRINTGLPGETEMNPKDSLQFLTINTKAKPTENLSTA